MPGSLNVVDRKCSYSEIRSRVVRNKDTTASEKLVKPIAVSLFKSKKSTLLGLRWRWRQQALPNHC